jgi:hypothetical protein
MTTTATPLTTPPDLGRSSYPKRPSVAEKAVLTRHFLQHKMAEYEKLREESEALQLEPDFHSADTNSRING